jgi:glycerol-3-phosphate acyltransferase PlsY
MGYVVGAIPTGYFFCKFFFGIDITQYGSGNIGASNVARVMGKKYFVLIALIDALKAYGVLALVHWLSVAYGLPAWIFYLVMASLLIGNAYSIFLNFSGGKGVATALGIMLFVLPPAPAGLFVIAWAGVLALTKQPFVASLVSIMLVLSFLVITGLPEQAVLIGAIAVWLLQRHRSNIMAWFQR